MIACVTGTLTAGTITWIRCTSATSNGTADGTTVYTNNDWQTGEPDDDHWQWFVVTEGDDLAELVPVTGRPWPSARAPRARRLRPQPARGVNVRIESWPVPGRTFR